MGLGCQVGVGAMEAFTKEVLTTWREASAGVPERCIVPRAGKRGKSWLSAGFLHNFFLRICWCYKKCVVNLFVFYLSLIVIFSGMNELHLLLKPFFFFFLFFFSILGETEGLKSQEGKTQVGFYFV